MAKKVQLMTNAKEWQTVNGVEVLVDVPQEDLDPITDSSCVEIEGHRTLEETINQDNMFTPEIVETKVHSKVGGVYHDNVVNGAYEEAILYGNTQVNLVESMTSGTKYIPHSFTSFQGNESKIGNYHSGRTNQVAPLVKGVTMVNLAQTTSVKLAQGQSLCVENIKGNTKYTISFVFTQKNNSAGIIIQSYNGETYLENSKLQSGLGDEVAITFITHENADTVYINNGVGYGGETIQLDNIMVIEGDVTDLNLPFFKGMRSVELSRPLTNLLDENTRYTLANASKATYTYDNGTATITATALGMYTAVKLFLDEKLKSNTTYLVMWDSRTYTSTSSYMEQQGMLAFDNNKHQSLGNSYPNENPLCPTLRSLMFNTGDTPLDKISIEIRATLGNSETGTTTVTGLRVFEWDDSLRTLDLQTIGYFSGTKYVSARALETEGKNLYPYGDINFTNDYVGWCDAKGNRNMYTDIASKSKTRFLLKKGTYTLKGENATNVEAWGITDDKNTKIVYSGQSFTINQDTYFSPVIKTIEANVATTVTNIQIERGETATTYEAYQSRYYKPRETEEIILRSLPNGVYDTFNLQTGELVQKIGEVVLDGSENWTINATYKYFCNSIRSDHKSRSKGGMAISDKVIYLSSEQIVTNSIRGFSMGGSEFIQLCEPSCTTINELKTYLQSNPITVQYELQEPVVRKITTYDRVYSGQTNALTNMGNNLSALTYYSSNYYVKAGNLSPVPAILEPITTIPYDVRLKPSTLYTVKYNRGGNSNSMSFDLGGSVVEKTNATDLGIVPEEFTVRTPAILSHEQLILSGTGYAHNFIIVEGDITGTELPYFEGMKDVKMPIVKNIGKNLFDGELIVDKGINQGTGAYHDSEDWVTTKNLIPITKGKKISITIDADDEDITSNRRYVYVYKYDMNGNFIANDRYDLGLDAKTYTMNHYGYIKCTIRTHNVKNITITETDTPQPCIDYRVNSVYAVQGEYPITSEMMEQGGFSMSGSSDGSYENSKYAYTARLRSKELIPVKPNTTYAFAHSFSKFAYNVYQWNGNKEFMEGTSQYFASGQIETITTTTDTQYIHFLMSKHDASQAITVGEYDWSQFHMYELDSTINLRSLPNGVKDELNLLTGEYIQRVGEVVLDNTETWNMDTTENAIQPNTNIFYTGVHSDFKPLATVDRAGSLVCDKVNVVPDLYFVDKVGIMSNTDPRIYVRVSKTDAPDVATFTTYIQNNPLTLQYELAEPITSHVRLVSNNQEREVGVKLPNGVSNTYNPSTGITTIRVGKIVLDGSEDWKEGGLTNDSYYEGWLPNSPFAKTMKPVTDISFINGNFVTMFVADGAIPHFNLPNSPLIHGGINIKNTSNPSDPGAIGFTIQKSKMTTPTLDGLKQYLASNPITVWYELKYPQIQPDIVLPNGVHDEYNPETGVYTKKVGFVELDGSENWTAGIGEELQQAANGAIDMYGVWTAQPLPNARPANEAEHKIPGVCDTFSFKNAMLDQTNEEFYFISTSGRFNMNIARTKLTGSNVSHLKAYLSQNPIKLWYELQTPITYQLTPYFGLPQPYAYEDGYLIHDSAYAKTTLPPEFKYKLVANRTGQVMQNNRKLQEHTTRLSNLEALIIEATIQSLFDRELQLFELELMDVQLIDLGE